MRRWGWLLSLLCCACAVPAAAGERTLPVSIAGFIGLPADSSDRREFMTAFREAMDADLPGEKRVGDEWSSAGPVRNMFRLVDVAPPDAAWSLTLSLGIPSSVRIARPKPKNSKITPRPRMSDMRVSRGLVIVATAQSPAAMAEGAPPDPQRFSVYFADARRVVVPSGKLPGGAYDFPWADAGRVVARAALEALHRANGEMAMDERADLDPATRAEEQP